MLKLMSSIVKLTGERTGKYDLLYFILNPFTYAI